MKIKVLPIFILFLSQYSFSQYLSSHHNFHLNPEFLIGISSDPNTDFPERDLQKQLFLNFGWLHQSDKHSWMKTLKTRKAGLSLGYTDLGNTEQLGKVFTIQPFLEFAAFRSSRFNVHVATGISYFTEEYNPVFNPNNRAVSTDLTWAFKMFLYYDLLTYNTLKWRLGAGYVHNSNGHTSLPNQGYNSFLLSLGLDVNPDKQSDSNLEKNKISKSKYYAFRFGYGINALSESINESQPVYIISGEYGKIYNGIFRLGIGAYARFYNMYYDYIKNNQSLVQDGREYENLMKNPFLNSLNFGLSGQAEVLLNHIGIDIQIGINIFKPSYELDWRLNQGWGIVPRDIPDDGGNFRLGDTDETYFYIKKHISGRLGLKYYLKSNKILRKENFYFGAFINSNLGQADFTEFAVGYVKQFGF